MKNQLNQSTRKRLMQGLMVFSAIFFFTCMATNGEGASVSSKFPIATTTTGEFSTNAAFDGTNYLVAMEKVYDDVTDTQTAQFISQSGTLVGPLISSGSTGGAPCVAFDGTRYLMVWPGDAPFVYGMFITTAGTSGSNFQISPTGIGNYGIAFGGGAYLVVYDKVVDTEHNYHVVYGKIVSPAGTVGSEFRISTGYGNLRHSQNIAFDGTNFLVVWTEDEFDFEIRGRFISSAGTPGTEFNVNASTYPSDNPMAVAFNGTNYLVTWMDEVGGYGSGEWDVFGQLIDKSGNKVGSVISVSTALGAQFGPLIAFDGANYLVTWTDMRNDANKDLVCDSNEGTCIDIYGQFISKAGTLVGSEFVISNDAGNQMGGVARFNNGKYLVLVNSGSGEFCHNPSTGQVSSDCDVYGIFITPAPGTPSGLFLLLLS